jgi:hypothetical protein
VAAVQEVEHAVGEHERPGQLRSPARRLARRTDLGFESQSGAGVYFFCASGFLESAGKFVGAQPGSPSLQ